MAAAVPCGSDLQQSGSAKMCARPGAKSSSAAVEPEMLAAVLAPVEAVNCCKVLLSVKLENCAVVASIPGDKDLPNWQRYLCVVCHGSLDEYCLLGVDAFDSAANGDGAKKTSTTVGMVAKLSWDTTVRLDGDGGFSVGCCRDDDDGSSVGGGGFDTTHLVFKPVSVQALWTVIQTLHHIISERLTPKHQRLRRRRQPPPDVDDAADPDEVGAEAEDWVRSWTRPEVPVSPQACINEWYAMDDILVRKRRSQADHENHGGLEEAIRAGLRSVMKTVDLDTVTSKAIRYRLELELGGHSLESLKSFVDEEILEILGQMDPASRILDYLYLGSEWNASNLEELARDGVTHILNVTREIDNFFPGSFRYKNIRVYDEEASDLLQSFDSAHRFIREARDSGSAVLVHCKMGISRSASIVASYLMKEQGSSLFETLAQLKSRRPIVNPNKGFLKQLEIYEGILRAVRNAHTYYNNRNNKQYFDNAGPGCVTLNRSKSESFLAVENDENTGGGAKDRNRAKVAVACKEVDVKAIMETFANMAEASSSSYLWSSPQQTLRPKSWSPSERVAAKLLEDLPKEKNVCRCFDDLKRSSPLKHEDPAAMAAVNSSSNYDPSCKCNVEVELAVPEEPVIVLDNTPDASTDAIVQRLAGVPIRIRSSGHHQPLPGLNCHRSTPWAANSTDSTSSSSCATSSGRFAAPLHRQDEDSSQEIEIVSDNEPSPSTTSSSSSSSSSSSYPFEPGSLSKGMDEDDVYHPPPEPPLTKSEPDPETGPPEGCWKTVPNPILDEQTAADVLSVRTLANMFSYKNTPSGLSGPACRPFCPRLEDNKLFQRGARQCQDISEKTPPAPTPASESEC